MFVDDQFTAYSSPLYKRKIGRSLAIVAGVTLILIFFSILSNYRIRKAAGHDPLPASSLVLPVAPLMLIGIGMRIGWGQTRINLRKGIVERRPLGVPRLTKIIQLKHASRLFVGYYRSPTMVSTPNSSAFYKTGKQSAEFWFIRLEGDKAGTMLVVQRSHREAVQLAQEIGERIGLDVEVQAMPGG